MIHNLAQAQSLIQIYTNELRDVNTQHDRMRFRKNMERIGQIAAYEISKTMHYQPVEIQTPLAIHNSIGFTKQPVVATILRAGVPLFDGLLNFFDRSDCAFVAAYRKHANDGGDSFTIRREYITCPDLTNRDLIIADPMLATGASLVDALDALKEFGKPATIHVVVAIASEIGIELIRKSHPEAHIWVAAIDSELTSKGYIVPGLGDAGDLSYGAKLQF
jgi:uracil phosphoribosyltransferase